MKYTLLVLLTLLVSCHKSISKPDVLKVIKRVPVVKLYEPARKVPDYRYVLKKDGIHREWYNKTVPGTYYIKYKYTYEDNTIAYSRAKEVTREYWDSINTRAVLK